MIRRLKGRHRCGRTQSQSGLNVLLSERNNDGPLMSKQRKQMQSIAAGIEEKQSER